VSDRAKARRFDINLSPEKRQAWYLERQDYTCLMFSSHKLQYPHWAFFSLFGSSGVRSRIAPDPHGHGLANHEFKN
jgi:hypothetical protein